MRTASSPAFFAMVLSRRTSAHVHTVFHVDFTTVDGIRRQKKADYERAGARLTFMPGNARLRRSYKRPVWARSRFGDS